MFYQRPNHNILTWVRPNGYNLCVASHTYMVGYIQHLVVHILAYEIPNCVQARTELHKYTYDNYFNKFK